ncbi:MAG: hypothetical protein CMJ78_00445 [Planctomycetaceae bacterium]|nr:hypothetical protein [Planctomycetaceae bacterium]
MNESPSESDFDSVPSDDLEPEPKADESDPTKPLGYKEAGRKLASRTTDLIAMAFVLIAGLIVGERIIGWWAEQEEEAIPALAGVDPRWDIGGAPVDVDLGEFPYTLRRQSFNGDERLAIGRMAATCVTLLEAQEDEPLENLEFNQSEGKVLSRISGEPIVADKEGKWRVYEMKGLLPSVVAVVPGAEEASQDKTDVTGWRLAAWAFAYPIGKASTWLSFSFAKTSVTDLPVPQFPDIKLPTNTQRMLTVRSDRAGSMMSFKSGLRARAWVDDFHSLVDAAGWKLTGKQDRPVLTRQYELTKDGIRLTLDVRAENHDGGSAMGMINLMPGQRVKAGS